MNETREIPTCSLYMEFDELAGPRIRYDADGAELSTSLILRGVIGNTDDTRFKGKRCELTIWNSGEVAAIPGIDPEKVLGEVCGTLSIAKDVKPEVIGEGADKFEWPPIRTRVTVGDEHYRSIERLAVQAHDAGFQIVADVEISSPDFVGLGVSPFSKKGPFDSIAWRMDTKDLKTDEDQNFAVTRFELFRSPDKRIDHESKRPRSPRVGHDDPGFILSVLFTSFSYWTSFPSGYTRKLQFEGVVGPSSPDSIRGIKCDGDIVEFEKDWEGDGYYPKEAYCGKFEFYIEPDSRSAPWISLELRCVKKDLESILLPFANLSEPEALLLRCYVKLDEKALSEGKAVWGDIFEFELRVHRHKPEQKRKGLW